MEVNIDKLVEQITENITKRTNNSFSSNIKGKSVLFIIPNLVFGFDDFTEYIKKEFKDFNIHFTAQEEILDSLQINKDNRVLIDMTSSAFLTSVNRYEKVVLLSPKVEALKSLSKLDDDLDINHILLGRLMANQFVGILLNVNIKVAAKLSKLIVDLKNIGFNVVNIQQEGLNLLSDKKIITEKDIAKILDSDLEVVKISKNQIITPLAKDKLRDNKIIIEYSEED